MNLYVFGHSITWRKPVFNKTMPNTFVDILFEKYNVPEYDHAYTYPYCSTERILYFLKKIKQIDVAIIFYGLPEFFFAPSLDKDFILINEKDYYWDDPLWEKLNTYPSVIEDRPITPYEWKIKRNSILNQKNHITNKEFKSKYYDYLKYFHTVDLCRNRHYGALTQIDQYVNYKKIPVIHCPLPKTLPTWFNFTSGIVDTELYNYEFTHSCKHTLVKNAITEKGNQLIAEKLISYIDKLVEDNGIEPSPSTSIT